MSAYLFAWPWLRLACAALALAHITGSSSSPTILAPARQSFLRTVLHPAPDTTPHIVVAGRHPEHPY